jgi:sugar fermentation stimulation protein A
VPVRVDYGRPARPVRFLARPNRYLAIVRDDRGRPPFEAHVPNPGRMEELLVPGETQGWVVAADGPERRTHFDLVAVRHGRTLVSIDSRIANRLVARALAAEAIPSLGGTGWRAEVQVGRHRFDFARFDPKTGVISALLEVKSSNLKVGRWAMFPDAPTVRGREHLLALARARRRGIAAHVLFAIQRSDVDAFRPNRALDPEFARALDLARRAGVCVHAYRLRVRPEGVALLAPVQMEAPGSRPTFLAPPPS